MLIASHPSNTKSDAVHPQLVDEQFDLCSRWTLIAGSIVACIFGIFWLMVDCGILLYGLIAIWTHEDAPTPDGVNVLASVICIVWVAGHSLGGVGLLWMAMKACCQPYQLILDGKGSLIALSMNGEKRIRLESINAIAVNLETNCDETAKPGIVIQHLDGEVELALFNAHQKFIDRLKTAYPAIDVYINGIGAVALTKIVIVDNNAGKTIAS
jgi:hypothetical protein